MGKKTSVYLPDGLAADVKDSGLSLRDLIHLGLNAKPRAIDPAEGERTWITWWFCDPPGEGGKFKCLRDGWHTSPDGIPVREIYEIQITHPATIRPDLGEEQTCKSCGTRLHRMPPRGWPFVDDKNRVHGIRTDTKQCEPTEIPQPDSAE